MSTDWLRRIGTLASRTGAVIGSVPTLTVASELLNLFGRKALAFWSPNSHVLGTEKRASDHERPPFTPYLGASYQSQQPNISRQHSTSSAQQSVWAIATPAINSKRVATLNFKSLFFIGMFLL